MEKHYLVLSDFDQTLSFNDSGHALAEMLGIDGFGDKVAGLSQLNLVQQGAELAYLLRHDPEFRRVRRQDLYAVGKQIRLKRNVELLTHLLAEGMGHIQTKTLFVARPVGERSALVPPFIAGFAIGEWARTPVVHVVGTFDADDLGAEVSQESGSPRKHVDLFKGQYPDTREHRLLGHGGPPLQITSCLISPRPANSLSHSLAGYRR
jgi:hypothetical protein